MLNNVMGIILAAGKGTRMKSDLPKVLHKVKGTPMVTHCVKALEAAGVNAIAVVVGYRKELVMEELGNRVSYVTQKAQQGTGDAVAAASDAIRQHGGRVLVVYGDNPLLNATSLRKLMEVAEGANCGGSILTISLENPPVAGRIVRDGNGAFARVVEEQDCTPEQKEIREVNVGTYCFQAEPLLKSLEQLKPNNSQGEYYLTDVPGYMVDMGYKIETVQAQDLFETLGVNDPHHLAFAEMTDDIRFAEAVYPIVDASLEMEKKSSPDSPDS